MSSKILGKNESQYVPSRFHLRRVSGAIATIKSKLNCFCQYNIQSLLKDHIIMVFLAAFIDVLKMKEGTLSLWRGNRTYVLRCFPT
jgi:hypothetical protein